MLMADWARISRDAIIIFCKKKNCAFKNKQVQEKYRGSSQFIDFVMSVQRLNLIL